MAGVTSAGEVRRTYWRQHDRPGGQAQRESRARTARPSGARARGSPAPELIQLEVLSGAGVPHTPVHIYMRA